MSGLDQLALAYLVSAILFILGIKGLASPRTARLGNVTAMAAMTIAIVTTLFSPQIHDYALIIIGIMVGAAIGAIVAKKVEMTHMPQLVGLLNSFGGLAAVLIALGALINHLAGPGEASLLESVAHKALDGLSQTETQHSSTTFMLELAAGTLIGGITFTGSVIAAGKLQGLVASGAVKFRGQNLVTVALLVLMLWLAMEFVSSGSIWLFLLLTILGLIMGVLLVMPIGGADMPVVIAVLNSYSGWAGAVTGFTLGNELLIITGSLVGASGAILSYIMCKAMNRSIINVVFGGFNLAADSGATTTDVEGRPIKSAAPDDAAFMMENADRVLIVPGYGMAVAQAQHVLSELVDVLEGKGVDVRFAIHPVAGRMPGHMNVLLAEADISYDKVFEMEEINPDFATTDVVLVLGANDVTNPAAKTDKSSPIYGMPILDVERAQQIFFVKRSMNTGYAGVQNLLFYKDNCSLVFGDAKKVCEQMLRFLT